MTTVEHLLFLIAEEAGEVAQRASKAARFGFADIDPACDTTAAVRLVEEYMDLEAVMLMLKDTGLVRSPPDWQQRLDAKQARVRSHMEYSRQVGRLTD